MANNSRDTSQDQDFINTVDHDIDYSSLIILEITTAMVVDVRELG